MGSLGGASWTKLSAIAPIIIPLLLAMPLLARGLNGLMLGEAEAYHLGIPVQRIKAMAILLVALAVGASVAAAGLIGFVGIVVPIWFGSPWGPITACCCRFRRWAGRSCWLAPTSSPGSWSPRPNCRSASSRRRSARPSSCGCCCAARGRSMAETDAKESFIEARS